MADKQNGHYVFHRFISGKNAFSFFRNSFLPGWNVDVNYDFP
jgi:hypothetical protein